MSPYYGYFPPSKPKTAKGGIKAQSKRGPFGESWWAKRWIEVLSGFNLGARLARGRSYARSGQVLAVEIGVGAISAMVQGSRSKPYVVTIRVKTLSPAEWSKVATVLSHETGHVAALLAGQMPQALEDVFKKAKVSLFPSRYEDLITECSCPDWSNPCKHIAAVYFLVAEEFDRDPFLLFKLRGMTRAGLIEMLQDVQVEDDAPQAEAHAQKSGSASSAREPLPVDCGAFWGQEAHEDVTLGEISVPAVKASLVCRLGAFPFWRGQEEFLPALETLYEAASKRGLAAILEE
ncbi:zinc finger SWIM domain protein [Solidesulfovibrio fructosivorans JJ]]|uniref:Zinc finger SWIM domain protein n=1 Tax=Solidesulfovibrio fructosivorans JJ] TaxID=596151 RepID=E1JSR9_SOLFR|nr:SWIM zinc finger family protein [Solidesulfovibrio fructosivorans]EFL52552.1 zinc finger SWIM domain protein [Solidesulfovibrio fructosivorans JJ]]